MVAKKKNNKTPYVNDGPYFLKLVLFVIIGSQWLWLVGSDGNTLLPIPVGFIVGLLFARHEHFQIDRKIEYAVLLIAALISFWGQVGIYVNI